MSDKVRFLAMEPHLPHHRVIAVDAGTGLRAESDMGLPLFRARLQAYDRLKEMVRNVPDATPIQPQQEPDCPDCGLPHPSRNPYCFCRRAPAQDKEG